MDQMEITSNSRLLTLLFLPTLTLSAFGQLSAQETQIGVSTKVLPLPGEVLTLNGHDAFVILPPEVKPNTPWVWYAPTLENLPGKAELWMFERFLAAGIAIAGIDVGESYGSPAGREHYSTLYKHLVETRQFSKQPVLLARSRGGLMLYSWATENSQLVGGIAGIYPVCNIASYPGLDRAAGAFQLTTEQLRTDLGKYNPIDRLAPLAAAGVPIFHIHGDDDKVVPLEANSGTVAERYGKLSGQMTLEVVAGQGHNMWTGWFESEKLTSFVITHAITAANTKP
jgi:hypothetical protein